MNWHDDFTLEAAPRRRGTIQLALYAQHLATGNSMLCRSIKADTVSQYLLAVATFLALFGPKERDFRKEANADKSLSPLIQGVLDDIR